MRGEQRAADNLARLDVLLAALISLPYDEWLGLRFGQLKAQLELAGERLSDLDLQIAAIALEHQAILVTQPGRHFSRLTSLAGLELEDWLWRMWGRWEVFRQVLYEGGTKSLPAVYGIFCGCML